MNAIRLAVGDSAGNRARRHGQGVRPERRPGRLGRRRPSRRVDDGVDRVRHELRLLLVDPVSARRGDEERRLRTEPRETFLQRSPQGFDLRGWPLRVTGERPPVAEDDERRRRKCGRRVPGSHLARPDLVVGNRLAVRDRASDLDLSRRQQRLELRIPTAGKRVDQDDACCDCRVATGEELDAETAERRADHHVRRREMGRRQQRAQVLSIARGAVWQRPLIAATEPGAVVTADRRERGDLVLDRRPDIERVAETCVEDHDRSPAAGAIDHDVAPTTDVDRTRKWPRGRC